MNIQINLHNGDASLKNNLKKNSQPTLCSTFQYSSLETVKATIFVQYETCR